MGIFFYNSHKLKGKLDICLSFQQMLPSYYDIPGAENTNAYTEQLLPYSLESSDKEIYKQKVLRELLKYEHSSIVHRK